MDVDKLKAILDALQGTDVTRLTWTDGPERLDLRLGHPPVIAPVAAVQAVAAAPLPPPSPASPAAPSAPASSPATNAAPAVSASSFTINSPFVGTFYRSPSPDSPAFVDVGSMVKKGQVLCIVEAMKLMNEIEADQAGRLTDVLVQNGSPVEYGQPLFRFEPA